MLAMQYSVRLPREYDFSKVQQRVRERRGLFEGLDGLVHKSYLFDPRNNVWAPFYVWENNAAARRFLLDGLFDGVVESFGRPRVRSWSVLNQDVASGAPEGRFAYCAIDQIGDDGNLAEIAEGAREDHQRMMARPGIVSHLVALDAERWELVRFSLWANKEAAEKPVSDCVNGYDVLSVTQADEVAA